MCRKRLPRQIHRHVNVCNRENKFVRKPPGLSADIFYFPPHYFDSANDPLSPRFENLMAPEKLCTDSNVKLYQEKINIFSTVAGSGVVNTEKQILALAVASIICWLNILFSCYPR